MFDLLSQRFSSIFSQISGNNLLNEKNLESTFLSINDALLEADVPYDIVQSFIAELKTEVLGQKVTGSLRPAEQLTKIAHDKILRFLSGGSSEPENFDFQLPSVVMMLGLQGSGKTTSIAKLTQYVLDQATKRGKKRKILVSSVDFYRPAAIEQLQILAKQVGVDFYRPQLTEPVAAAGEILNFYKSGFYDILFLDTAGRLHIDESMIKELQEIDRLVKPKYKFLVIDAMTGQESLTVGKEFESKVGFSGAILTKLDSDARGGLAFAFRYAIKKPISFIGIGEKPQDLELFRPARMASRIIGMGDIATLVEKADQKIKQEEQRSLEKSIASGRFTLQDFADQMSMVNKLGSIGSLLKYLPGAGSFKISSEQIASGERDLKKFRAIICSMTPKERIMPKVLDKSRKLRVASGAGVTVADVNFLLERFEQTQQFMKIFGKMAKR